MVKTIIATQIGERFFAQGHSAAIAPNDRGAQHLLIAIDNHQAVHLVRDTYGINLVELDLVARRQAH